MARKRHKVSDVLRAAIDSADSSRYRIALDAEVDHASLSRFMNGTCGLSLDSVDRLAEVLGLELAKKHGPKRKGTKKGR